MRRVIVMFMLFAMTLCTMAEPNCKFNPKKYKEEQQQYIIQKAKLTPKDAKVFFSLYDEMRAEERKLFSKIGFNKKKHPQTEEECYKAIVEKDKAEIRLKKIQQQYHQKMLKALPAKVVMKCLYFAEHFDRKKLREASSRQVRRNVKRK